VLDALAGPHREGHVHRDLKPSNIIVDPGGRVRLIDFGIAAVEGATQLTGTYDRPGTRRYMAPEQLVGMAVDGRADLYALGATLRDLVTGLPGCGEPEELPPGLAAIVRKAMHEHPDDRFQDALQMREALEARVQERWGGAPVLEFDRLSANYSVRSSLMRLGPQAWLFEGLQHSTEGQVGILLTAGGRAGEVLLQAHRACPRLRRNALDYKDLGLTEKSISGDQHHFAVFDGLMDLEQRVHDFLGPRHLAILRGVEPPPEEAPQALPSPAPPPPAVPLLGEPVPPPAVEAKDVEQKAKGAVDKADQAARKEAELATKAAGVAGAVGAAAVVAGVATLAGAFMKAQSKNKKKKRGV
jgi:hypothetical protein